MINPSPVPVIDPCACCTLLRESITINDEDLRQLASLRARMVKEELLRTGKVEAERIFLVESKSLQPEQKEKLGNSRVDFSLK